MTHRLASTLLASALLAGLAGTAVAQPSTTAAPGAAPQTHDWNEVNHVNGQLVPVGETNSYLKDYRRTNISSNPIGWMVGFYGISASYGINNHVAIRADANYISPVDSNMTMTELGVGAPLYLRRTYQGAFVEPGLIVRHTEYDNDGDYHEDGETTVGPQVLFGWHWTWDSGFNVAMAAGLGRDLADDGDDEYDSDEDVFFNGYFRVGYAF
jgi:hypothetical protein